MSNPASTAPASPVISLDTIREAREAQASHQADLAASYRPGARVPTAKPSSAFLELDWTATATELPGADSPGTWTTEDPRTGMRFRLVAIRRGWGGQVIRPGGSSFLVNWSSSSVDLAAAQAWAEGWLDTAAATADLPLAAPAPVVTQPKVRPALAPARSPIEQFLTTSHPGSPPNDWEVKFLRDIYGRERNPTAKQREVLDRIERKTMADLPRLGDFNRQ